MANKTSPPRRPTPRVSAADRDSARRWLKTMLTKGVSTQAARQKTGASA